MSRKTNVTTLLLLAVIMMAAAVLVSCSAKSSKTADTQPAEYVPDVPDYSDFGHWYISDRSAPVDIFYITSTETGDYWLPNGSICHYADTYRDSTRLPLFAEMLGVDTLISGRLNFYSPYYRQCSIQSFISDDMANERLQLPLADVLHAYGHYMTYYNNGRPYILVGYSQGAMLALHILSRMTDDTYGNLVAAYIIGASIPENLLAEAKHVLPAQGADDTGVTICYNSVRDVDSDMWPRNEIAINPVNWRTDSTTATLITEPTPLLPVSEQQKDTLLVKLDPVSNLLIVSGYTATDYILPLIGKEGNYHSREIWLYRDQLRENMQQRADAFLKKR